MAAELLETFESGIKLMGLIPSKGGAFEVKVNDILIYSKLQNGRHPEMGEVKMLLRRFIEEG